MLLDDAKILADKLRASEEYRNYRESKERAYAQPSTAALLDEFYALRMKTQAAAVAGTLPVPGTINRRFNVFRENPRLSRNKKYLPRS